MTTFKRIPASKRKIASRSLVYGVGINDAWYNVKRTVSMKTISCEIYEKWRGMIRRCYSDKFQIKNPTYKGCTVCDEWLIFSNFEKWFSENYIKDCELDKDIKVKGNKIYGPNTCLFVPSEINKLLNTHHGANGTLPTGVTFDKRSCKYGASISINGSGKWLGTFKTQDEAEQAYVIAKNSYILSKCGDPYFGEYLRSHLST